MRLAVDDTGAGISSLAHILTPEETERLFEPFQCLDAGGVGLGLSIVRAVAEAHGAKVACRARPEGGLEVEVTFPSSGFVGPVRLGQGDAERPEPSLEVAQPVAGNGSSGAPSAVPSKSQHRAQRPPPRSLRTGASFWQTSMA